MPFFSVIIPVYNKEKYLKETLTSVLGQTFTDFELILVNDGSTDQSPEIINRFQDHRIRIHHQENQGAAAARNTGIQLATGNYLAFLDADDLWLANHLEELQKLIQDFPGQGIYANRYQLQFKNGKTLQPTYRNLEPTYRGVLNNYYEVSETYSIIWTSCIAIPKEVLEQTGGFNKNISSGQDIDLWMRIVKHHTFAVNNHITATYRHYVSDSLSKTAILTKKLMDLSVWKEDEKNNPYLKKFLDRYRMEYALHFKMAGAKDKATEWHRDIDPAHTTFTSKLLYRLPAGLLRGLLYLKKKLRDMGLDLSIYK